MNNRQLLKKLASEVNNLLSAYVAVHNLRLSEGGSFRSLFRKVDFLRIYTLSKKLLNKFEEKKEELEQIKEDFYEEFTHTEKEFFDFLSDYFEALHDTVKNLYALAEAQHLKSENKVPLSWDKNRRLEDDYKKSIEKYYCLLIQT